MTGHAELVRELKALRKGRGLYVNNVGERVGPALRDLCGVTEQDGLGEIRVRVAQRLERLAADLPDDLRMATLAAFGMIPAARHPLYQDRVGWIARKMERDPRTVRRRIDEAIHQLAERAVTPLRLLDVTEPASALWHIEEIRMILLLDHAAAEVLELHRIVAGQDHLRELELSTTFGQPEVIYGGTLRGGTLVLPAPLAIGESYEFAVRSRNAVRPRQFLHIPHRPCDVLVLRVRFDRDQLPHMVSRLQGRPPRERGQVVLDGAGEIRLIFKDLVRGVAYGARWD